MRRRRLGGGWNPGVERRGFRIARGTVVGGLIVAGIGAGVLHNRLQASGKADPVLSTAQAVSVPAQVVAARASQGVSSRWQGLFRGQELENENERLKAELATLKLEVERRAAVDAENQRLREALDFTASKNPRPQVAEVIAWLPTSLEQTLTLAVGTRQGVRRDQVVRTPDGLLGKIVDSGPFSAKVRLLTDPDCSVGVTVAGGKAFGILRGVEEGRERLNRRYALELIHLEIDAAVKVGDKVETSGQGGVFPPGIPVGTIESIHEDTTHLLKVARVKPFAPMPGMVREVLVLPPSPSLASSDTADSAESRRP
jgi:rod shape-determining protein MreC